MAINNQPRSFQQWPQASYAPAPVSATPPDFNLDAGVYGLALAATTFGTAVLQKLLPDGTTYVAVSPVIAAASYSVYQLPAGRYRLALTGVTALVGEIALIARGSLRG